MRYELHLQDANLAFQETETGILDIAGSQSGCASPSVVCQEFSFEEIQQKATIKIMGNVMGYSGSSPLIQGNYAFIVHLTKLMAYLNAGVYSKTAHWLNCNPMEMSRLVLVKALLSKTVRQNLFLEYLLGSYEEKPEMQSNTARLLEEIPEDTDLFAHNWYVSHNSFYTRVVGFKYRMQRFIRSINGEEILTIKPGDAVFVIHETENKHDPNAVALIHASGEKLGYLRRNITKHLAPIMDKGRLYTAEVTAVLGLYRQADELVHIKMGALYGV